MRVRFVGLALFLVFALPGCATRPSAPPVAVPVDVTGDVATEFRRSTAGWNAGDLEAFMAIYAENATFARRDNFVTGKAAIRVLYAPFFAPGADRHTLTLERLEVEELCPGMVLVRGIYRNSREGAVIGRGTTTLLMRQVDGHWRIVHDHSS